jgi:hypothetical protein
MMLTYDIKSYLQVFLIDISILKMQYVGVIHLREDCVPSTFLDRRRINIWHKKLFYALIIKTRIA